MAHIVIAGASEENRTHLARLLTASGFSQLRVCGDAGELRRALSVHDGVVILLGSLPGLQADELKWDWGDRIQVLLIASPAVLERCESPDVFRLPLPSSVQAVLGAVEMLSQLHHHQMPRRSGAEKTQVDLAKAQIMEKLNMTEPEAHRALQRLAMRTGLTMTVCAGRILDRTLSMDAVVR